MKRHILSLLLLLSTLCSLFACGPAEEVTAPEGMKLCGGGKALGYYLFIPDAWTPSVLGNISAAYVSTVDTTSVSLTEASIGEGESFDAYFARTMQDFPLPYTMEKAVGEACNLGNADRAQMYVYTCNTKIKQEGEYVDSRVRCLSILATAEGESYLFTYTASDEERDGMEGTPYTYWFSYVEDIMKHVKFIPKEGAPERPVVGEPDADGYALVSDPEIAGFSFYTKVDEFAPTLSSGIVEVRSEDGSTVNLSEITGTGVSVDKYWENRKAELTQLFGTVTVLPGKENVITDLGNSSKAASYEYSYSYAGKTYKVYQVCAIAGSALTVKGFVFTYTAEADKYDAHIDTVMHMAERVVFA